MKNDLCHGTSIQITLHYTNYCNFNISLEEEFIGKIVEFIAVQVLSFTFFHFCSFS